MWRERERSKKVEEEDKIERKCKQRVAVGKITRVPYSGMATDPLRPCKKETREKELQ